MNLVLIFGPPAVGKMTVGQELEKITNYKLFFNHMSCDLVNHFFDFGTPEFERLDKKIRFAIFEEIAKSKIKGLIFTLVWAIDYKEDEEYVDELLAIFKAQNWNTYLVELQADLEQRLIRNKTENRLNHKPTKRDLEQSEKVLLYDEKAYRMNTLEGELPDKNIYKIDNTKLSAAEVAALIKGRFGL